MEATSGTAMASGVANVASAGDGRLQSASECGCPAPALETLKRYFGYTSFRPGQDRMVSAILSGRDALGVMPTGAGKSICYQVPALMMPGITLVVSPLVSLMADQVRSLKAAGARPAYLNSTLTPGQQNTVLKRASEGWYQIMYVAPERLSDPRFLAFAQRAAAPGGLGVPLVAVDEAHCVSQWGQDFRPAYLAIADFVAALPQRPVLAAFTATATERVRADIAAMLGLRAPETVVTGFDRTNLYFGVEELGEKAKLTRIRDYVLEHAQESGIVYCSTRKATDELAAELGRALGPHGVRVGRYHAGMGVEERRRAQDAFICDDMSVIVATNAFGMGIDKPNVRYVIHHNVPESIEAYYQEAGRAGRDGDPASCLLLWNGNDFRIRRFLIDQERDDEALDPEQCEQARRNRFRLLSQMEGYCKTTGCLREYILRYFGDEAAGMPPSLPGDAAEGCGNCSNCLTSFAVEDVTDAARAAVRFVAARPGRFGKTVIADALHGADNERVRSYRLDEVAGCGSLADMPATRIREVIDQLAGRGYLSISQGQYPVVGLGPRAVAALAGDPLVDAGAWAAALAAADDVRTGAAPGIADGLGAAGDVPAADAGDLAAGDTPAAGGGIFPPFRFTIKRRASKRAATRVRRAVDLLRDEAQQDARPRVGDDAELFEQLRVLRRELADERQVPAYVVCNDATLRGLCRRRPHTKDELLEVTGIGERKAEEYGEVLLGAIATFEAGQ